jgi:hypothetical protein
MVVVGTTNSSVSQKPGACHSSASNNGDLSVDWRLPLATDTAKRFSSLGSSYFEGQPEGLEVSGVLAFQFGLDLLEPGHGFLGIEAFPTPEADFGRDFQGGHVIASGQQSFHLLLDQFPSADRALRKWHHAMFSVAVRQSSVWDRAGRL